MTANELFAWMETMNPSSYTTEQKLLWLNELEGNLWKEVLLQPAALWKPRKDTELERPLLLPEGNTMLYAMYLWAMMDFARGEHGNYANSMALYNDHLAQLQCWYAENYAPAMHPAVWTEWAVCTYDGTGEPRAVMALPHGCAVLGAECRVVDAGNLQSITLGSGEETECYMPADAVDLTKNGPSRFLCFTEPCNRAVYAGGAGTGTVKFRLLLQPDVHSRGKTWTTVPVACVRENTGDASGNTGGNTGGDTGGNTGGGSGGTETTTHGIIWDLVNVTSSSAVTSVSDGASLVAVLTAADGYTLGDVTVTMGGEALTGVWNADTATVTIPSVTGDIIISCAGVEVELEVVEDLKTVAAFHPSTGAWPTKTLNDDGETYSADWTNVTYQDASLASSGDYWVSYFGQEVNGGVLSIVFDTALITKLETKILLVGDPIVPVFGTATNYHADTYVTADSFSGTAGDITITTLGTSEKSLLLTGSASIQLPEGYYPIVMFRRMQSSIVDTTINSNDTATKYFYDNVSITHKSGGVAVETNVAELVDADYTMDYGIATTSLVTDEATNTKVDIDETYAAVIEEAKNAWLTEANGDINKIPLLIHTDQHSNFNQPLWDFISEIVDWYDVGKVINLGDTVNSYGGDLLSDSGLESYVESMAGVPYSKRIEIFGNHDTWGSNEDGTGRFTPQNYLHKYFRNIYARRFDNHGNFVTYDDNYNVKYVVVSGYAYDSELGGYSHYVIPSASIDRIISELEKADGYDVVILSHVPLGTATTTVYNPTDGTTTETGVGGVNYKLLTDLWSGRKAKTSGSVTDEYGVSHDFDFTVCDGELLCGLHGHMHDDGYYYIGELLDVYFDAYYISPKAFYFVLIDRANRRLNVWKVDDTPQYQNYQIPFDKSGTE